VGSSTSVAEGGLGAAVADLTNDWMKRTVRSFPALPLSLGAALLPSLALGLLALLAALAGGLVDRVEGGYGSQHGLARSGPEAEVGALDQFASACIALAGLGVTRLGRYCDGRQDQQDARQGLGDQYAR
jgi:hypothetical protein